MNRENFLYISAGTNTSTLDLHFRILCSSAEELRFFVELLCGRFSIPIDHTALYSGRVNEKYTYGKYTSMLTKNLFDLHLNGFLRRWALDQVGIRIDGHEKFADIFPAMHLGGDFLVEIFSAATERGWELFQWHGEGAILLVHK
jgi:hypothetical protein